MNVLVTNVKQNELSNIDVDIIKNVNGQYDADEIITMFKDFFFEKMILDITSLKDYSNIEQIRKLAIGIGENKLILFLTDDIVAMPSYLSSLVSMGIYNFTNNLAAIKKLVEKPNSYKDVASLQQAAPPMQPNSMQSSKSNTNSFVNDSNRIRVLGVRNITDHAGASSLIFMLKKELSTIYGPSVYAIEINKKDFAVFNDKMMLSVVGQGIEGKIRDLATARIILVDLNDYNDESFCDDVLYLIEPSSIMLNKLVRKNRKIFEKLVGKKIVLNKCLLSNKDITEFEYEANTKVYYSIPPLDDRKSNAVLYDLLSRIGINDTASRKEDGSKIFGIFKR